MYFPIHLGLLSTTSFTQQLSNFPRFPRGEEWSGGSGGGAPKADEARRTVARSGELGRNSL